MRIDVYGLTEASIHDAMDLRQGLAEHPHRLTHRRQSIIDPHFTIYEADLPGDRKNP